MEAVRRRLGPEKASERRVCRVLGQPRSTQRYASKRPVLDQELLAEMRRIARRDPYFGSPRVYDALRKRGREVNHKRVERLWREAGMQVLLKPQKRRRLTLGGSENSCVRKRPERPNHIWSYDFVTDFTEKGRRLRMLVVIDEFTRESLAIEVAPSFTAQRVLDVLGYLFAVRGAPEHIRSDNGPEFVARSVRRWLDRACVKTLYVAKSSPWENGYVESFGQPVPGRAARSWVVPGTGGRSLDRRPMAAGLQPPPAAQLAGLPNPGRVRRTLVRLRSGGRFGYASAAPSATAGQRSKIKPSRFSHSDWYMIRGKPRWSACDRLNSHCSSVTSSLGRRAIERLPSTTTLTRTPARALG